MAFVDKTNVFCSKCVDASFNELQIGDFLSEKMDKLANYGSDDDYDDSPQYKRTECRPSTVESKASAHHQLRRASPQVDVNYDEVQMDMSEDSNSDSSSKEDTPPPAKDKYKRGKDERNSPKSKSRDSPKSYRSRRDEDERSTRKDDRESERGERLKERSRDSKHRDRYREERKSRRSSSREKQRSRSPRYRNRRSNSRDKGGSAMKSSGYTRRFDRASNKMAQLEKLGIEIKTPDCQFMSPSDLQRSMEEQKRKGEAENRFFMPGITGRFRDQIERRKMLWQKKEPEKKEVAGVATTAPPRTSVGRVWETTTFAQDTDGKVANKFKRLMGIKASTDEPKPTTDTLKKQEEMFSSMEAQYEVARTATHTMRGVGLGFGSFQR